MEEINAFSTLSFCCFSLPSPWPVEGRTRVAMPTDRDSPAQLTTQAVSMVPCSVSTALTLLTPVSSSRTVMPVTGQFSITCGEERRRRYDPSNADRGDSLAIHRYTEEGTHILG